MSTYLAYSYSIGLTEEEKIEIDKKTKKSREEFKKGFVKGASFSLTVISLYSLMTSAACAADATLPQTTPKTPGGDPGAVQPIPTQKPEFKPRSDGTKGAFVGGASAICGAALQSGDFYLGVACAVLLVIGGIVVNRP